MKSRFKKDRQERIQDLLDKHEIIAAPGVARALGWSIDKAKRTLYEMLDQGDLKVPDLAPTCYVRATSRAACSRKQQQEELKKHERI